MATGDPDYHANCCPEPSHTTRGPMIVVPKSGVGTKFIKDWAAHPCEFLGCAQPAELVVHDRRNRVPDYRMCARHARILQQEFDWVTLWHLSYRQPGD